MWSALISLESCTVQQAPAGDLAGALCLRIYFLLHSWWLSPMFPSHTRNVKVLVRMMVGQILFDVGYVASRLW